MLGTCWGRTSLNGVYKEGNPRAATQTFFLFWLEKTGIIENSYRILHGRKTSPIKFPIILFIFSFLFIFLYLAMREDGWDETEMYSGESQRA